MNWPVSRRIFSGVDKWRFFCVITLKLNSFSDQKKEQIKQYEQIGEFGSDFCTPTSVVVKSTLPRYSFSGTIPSIFNQL